MDNVDPATTLSPTAPFARLRTPAATPAGESWHYGLAWPMQVRARSWGLMCNLRRDESPTVDFETGTDFVPMDVDGPTGAASPVSRNHVEPDPGTGEDLVMVKYPAAGGFVPAGALRQGGSAHPRAGTGFGVALLVDAVQRLARR